jgi:hypothetical protein
MSPICPLCKTKMVAKYFVGYYESFSFWRCECEIIPGATIEAGCYSYAENNVSYEEAFGEHSE